jgi:ATP phosphoribosyltransferase regulatory subunit
MTSRDPDERIAAELRALFESRGFRRTTPGKFEDYHLYMDNRNFLDCEHIITFMDMDGRLLALKPDVTLSIVKNIPGGGAAAFEKLYYVDEVYRPSRENRDYKVMGQIGVELIGRRDPFSNIEAVSLALEALSVISGEFVLDISHLGFVTGIFGGMELSSGLKAALLGAIHRKSAHELSVILRDASVPEGDAGRILALSELHGPFQEVLPRLSALCANDQMRHACGELSQLGEVLCKNGGAGHVFLDFSVVSDLDYYNGLLFLGYVRGVPKAVLSGGRYDNLLRRMGKESDAIGFAVSLSELNLYRRSPAEYDFDALIRYEAGCSMGLLLEQQTALIQKGLRTRLEPEGSGKLDFTCRAGYRFTKENKLEEAASC